MTSGLAASGLLSISKRISSSGSVKAINVGVFWDPFDDSEISSVDWEEPSPGDVVNITIYVRNTGNAPMTLSLTTSGWSPPSAEVVIHLSWDREGYVISVGDVISAELSLNVSNSISGITDFSFDIIIEGTG
jgi:hypothetical protein